MLGMVEAFSCNVNDHLQFALMTDLQFVEALQVRCFAFREKSKGTILDSRNGRGVYVVGQIYDSATITSIRLIY